MGTIALEHVQKEFRGTFAVRDLTFTVNDGELVSLVGPSGCGKSTTLNVIAGLERPTGGTVRIDGRVVNDVAPGARDLAMVFQSYALYPHLDVRRNLAFPLEVAGVARAEIDTRVRETAQLLGIAELLARRPRELSGGQRQRVALGRALVRRPTAFLLDEPLSNLDAELRLQMRAELKRLHERLRATFVYVTHDQAEAMTLSTRVVVLNRGTIQQIAPPREIYDRPANLFVAGFFGTPRINVVAPEAIGLRVPAGVTRVGIRPEHLEIGRGPAPSGALVGRVDLLESMGSENWVTVALASTLVTVRARAEFEAPAGSEVWIALSPRQIHHFAADGRRVDPGAA